mgnify:CR=1 FL=1
MLFLWLTTLLWAFSFSFIGVYLAGQVDSYFSVFTRTALALLVFLPFLVRYRTSPKIALQMMLIGALQLGLMYLFYYHSFLLLTVPEILVFTIFTPIYITLLNDLISKTFHTRYLLGAVLAIIGAAVIRWDNLNEDFWLGFLVVQGANLCFATGQVLYKHRLANWPNTNKPPQFYFFGWFYLGALTISLPAWLILGKPMYPTSSMQWGVLLWLGVVASGLGYFLWNYGATKVNTGQLATMNNMLIPAGLLVNLIIWNHNTDLVRLLSGSAIMFVALLLAEGRLFKRSTE